MLVAGMLTAIASPPVSGAVTEEAADGASLIDLDDLPPAARRELAVDVLNSIALMLALAAVIVEDKRLDLASIFIGLAAISATIYWRLTRKLD
jgi:hypothetical protein